MKCSEIKFGSYDCAYVIYLPWKTKFPWKDDSQLKPKCVFIDKCLLPEIIQLWEMGIKTTGCCCGHGRKEMACIAVQEKYMPKMKKLDYEVWFNPCRPKDEDFLYQKRSCIMVNLSVKQ